jgi:hypothetical protein
MIFYFNETAEIGERIFSTVQLYVPGIRPSKEQEKEFTFQALWDTGTRESLITSPAITKLDLKSKGEGEISGTGGTGRSRLFDVDIIFNNGYEKLNWNVYEYPGAKNKKYGLVIGMDIISLGDFAITQKNGKAFLSFRTPPKRTIDFEKEDKED